RSGLILRPPHEEPVRDQTAAVDGEVETSDARPDMNGVEVTSPLGNRHLEGIMVPADYGPHFHLSTDAPTLVESHEAHQVMPGFDRRPGDPGRPAPMRPRFQQANLIGEISGPPELKLQQFAECRVEGFALCAQAEDHPPSRGDDEKLHP